LARSRNIAFSLYEAEDKILEGFFTVTGDEGFSVFGKYNKAETTDNGEIVYGDFFSGLTFEHSMKDDGSISMVAKLYGIEPSDGNAFGIKQVTLWRTGISMGSESGEDDVESVALGNKHEFVWRSKKLA
jgi:hypothetical protein